MNNELEDLLKTEMNYTETNNRCDKCMFYKERENPFLDRSWISECSFNSIGHINIKQSGRCDKFISK